MVYRKTNFKKCNWNDIENYPATERQQEEVEACKRFIGLYFQHATAYEWEHSSYGLKHQVEHWLQTLDNLGVSVGVPNYRYVSNEAFIKAMFELCYTSTPTEPDSPNLVFKYKYIGPRIWNGYKYTVPMTQCDWDQALNVLRQVA